MRFLVCALLVALLPQPAWSAPKPDLIDPATGIEFVLVKGGTFLLGDMLGVGSPNERPGRAITISDYYISKYEITLAQWHKVMGGEPPPEDRAQFPVSKISWFRAMDFVSALNKLTSKKYRLPTEAEWEYAARSGADEQKWAGTSVETDLGDYAWYEKNATGGIHPVGQKKPNGLGLYDMTGNVWEWCIDWFDEEYYSHSARTDPPGPQKGKRKVARGGAWNSSAWIARVSYRARDWPQNVYNYYGFRIVLPVRR